MYNYPQYAKAYPQYFGSTGPKPPVPEPEHPEYFTYGVTNINKLYGVTGLKDEYKDIKEITIPKISDEGIAVEAIGVDAFKNSTIEKVHIQSNVLAIGNRAFYGTGSLIECTIDEGVNKAGYGIFSHSSLSEITIPNSLNNYGSSYDAFGQDSNITKVTFKEGRTKIVNSTCEKMMKLVDVVVPKSIKTIGDYTFNLCSKLTNVEYAGNEAEYAQITIGTGNDYFKNATVTYNG